jgi:hypothetical protein
MTTETGSTSVVGTPAGGASTAGTSTTTTQASQAQAWYETIEDQSTVTWAKSRGYKLDDPADVARHALTGHYNAEKLIGLDRAGRTLVIPKEDATPQELEAFASKLGRPAASKDYKFPEALAALKDDPMAAAFADAAHKAGYNDKQFAAALEFTATQAQAQQAAQEQQREIKAQADVASLRTEWGGEFELRTEAARRAVRELGLSAEEAGSIEQTLGVRKSAELFFKIGKGLLEDTAEGLKGGSGAKFGLSPTEAKAEIKALQSDPGFIQQFASGDREARAKMDRLSAAAYGS